MPRATQGKVTVTINYEVVKQNFERWAELALGQALDECSQKAKERAPVRDIFGGQRPAERVPRGIFRRNGQIFGRRIRHHTQRGQERFLKQVNAQTKPKREYRMPSFGTRGEYLGTERVRGNPRTWDPVVRATRTAPWSAGQFRRAKINFGKAQMEEVAAADLGSKRQRYTTGAEFFTKRGRWELRRAQKSIQAAQDRRKAKGLKKLTDEELRGALASSRMTPEKFTELKAGGGKLMKRNSAIFTGSSGETTLGGRLRDEIFPGSVRQTSTGWSGDVVSPTYYAKYQEYGTSRHRAQPFMRPALYEMRKRLPVIVKQVVAGRK
jgi:HK97 gp10 family phage protein